MKTRYIEATFALCDPFNPGFGYQLRITDGFNGDVLLFTSRHPVTGEDLLTAADCAEVISYYIAPRAAAAGV